MPLLLPLAAIFLAGISFSLQAPTNAALAKASGSVVLAALVSFVIGTATLLAMWAIFDRTTPTTLRSAPNWAWFGGFYGAGFVTAMSYAAPRLGLATALTVAIASQIGTAIVLDHFGLLGLKAHPVSAVRVAGAAMVLAGAVLVRRG